MDMRVSMWPARWSKRQWKLNGYVNPDAGEGSLTWVLVVAWGADDKFAKRSNNVLPAAIVIAADV